LPPTKSLPNQEEKSLPVKNHQQITKKFFKIIKKFQKFAEKEQKFTEK